MLRDGSEISERSRRPAMGTLKASHPPGELSSPYILTKREGFGSRSGAPQEGEEGRGRKVAVN